MKFKNILLKITLFVFLTLFSFVFAQNPVFHFVYFKNKPNANAFFAHPESELSIKALERRHQLGLFLNLQDAPIENSYINQLENLGFSCINRSKWMNGVALRLNIDQVNQIKNLDFVQSVVSFAKNTNFPNRHRINKWKNFENKIDFNYGTSASQIDQIRLKSLHQKNFTGKDIDIAVIDTGFPTVNTGSAFARMRENNQIKSVYNFISKNEDVYNLSLNGHGTNCLGIIGGYLENQFVGSAPDANFHLFATEVGAVEIPEEEVYWAMAAEEADRKGVDMISSSLGYSEFDESIYDYTYNDMNGKTTFIARAAQIACEKGIIIMISAGNEGSSSWHYIVSPGDNAEVFTIGAVTSTSIASSFTSYGPNSLNHPKPDASARGTGTALVYNNTATSGNGTSYANPLSAGGVACLLQALPANTSRNLIKNKLRETASLAPIYNERLGFGILNFEDAYLALSNDASVNNKKEISFYPNPTSDFVFFSNGVDVKNIEVYDNSGRLLNVKKNNNVIDLRNCSPGNYLLNFKINNNSKIIKIIKK